MERGTEGRRTNSFDKKTSSRGTASSVHHHKTLNSHKGAPTFCNSLSEEENGVNSFSIQSAENP